MAGIIQTVKNTIAENFGGPSHSLAPKEHQFSLDAVPDQTDKVAVITGGSRGIGYACSHTLLERNLSKLFIICSTQESVDLATEDITKSFGPSGISKVKFIVADMGDWRSLPDVAQQITSSTNRIDVMISCAGRGVMTYQKTTFGVDRHMAVNIFGNAILTAHLLPLMKKTAKQHPDEPVRLVLMGSNLHAATPSDCRFATLDELNTDLGPNAQYGRSKLAEMLYAKFLNRHLQEQNIFVNTVHPGFVDTKMSAVDIHEPYPIMGYANSVGAKPFKKTQWDGAVSAMYCATKTAKGGEYVCPPAIPELGSKLYQDEEGELERNLVELTKRLLKEKAGIEVDLY